MIVSKFDGRLLIVTQPDHGTQTGYIARAWGNDEIRPPEHHQHANHLAATHHDDGWAVWERHPDIDPETHQPMRFQRVAPHEHIPLYRAGIERAAQLDPWTGLMVSMHGAGLYNDRYGTYRLTEIGEQEFTAEEQVLVHEFLADMEALQLRLYTEATGHRPIKAPHQHGDVMASYLLLQVWDRISLQFALRHASDGGISPVPLHHDDDRSTLVCSGRGRFTMSLSPFPFANDRVELPVLARSVPDRDYVDPEDFLTELAAARPTTLECVALRA